MKRYRVLSFDLDARFQILTLEIRDEWEDRVKRHHRRNREAVERELIGCFGADAAAAKRRDFVDLGEKPFSILSFHNRFFQQIRSAFVMGSYYPSLTAACALGERILNHLLLTLRQDHRQTTEYKDVRRKESFDNWDVPIDTLESWGVLLRDVAVQFRHLKAMRQRAIHFRPEVDSDDRQLALDTVRCLSGIIRGQFSAFGPQPWFLTGVPGEIYIKKSWEGTPFVKRVYLPNCLLVGPKHRVDSLHPYVTVNDDQDYEEREVTDEEYVHLRTEQMVQTGSERLGARTRT